jgi:hypothetical protein
VVQKPFPDKRGAGAVSVGGFMAKNERCHACHFQRLQELPCI